MKIRACGLLSLEVVAACLLLPTQQASAALVLGPDGLTVYDTVNNISWLASANLPAHVRFGIPTCNGAGPQPCVNASGSMNYAAAAAWVTAMNAAAYLGHTNWQLPTTPTIDRNCGKTGANGASFGFNCTASAFGSLYTGGLGLKAPHTAVSIPSNTVGPFGNLQPSIYWSQTSAGSGGYFTFSFNNGFHGANTAPNFWYVLPVIQGKISGTPLATGKGLQVNPGGQTVYDPVANVTWLANANLSAANTFGLPLCVDPTSPALCVDKDGSMTWASANEFLKNMNAFTGSGYLGQTNWELPSLATNCGGYNCKTNANTLGELFYGQLGLSQGMPVVSTPNIAVGPFKNIQPYLYWACQADKIQDLCQTDGPAPNFEWSFSFGNGFQGTDLLTNDLYVTAYFVGAPAAPNGPVVSQIANAEGEGSVIAPNTWVEIKGVALAPAGDTRVWQDSDFVNGKMPTQLDGVSVMVNGKSAFVYFISPTQVNILTPPDVMAGPAEVQLTSGRNAGVLFFTQQSQELSPSIFVFNGGPYAAAVHAAGGLVGPVSLYPGSTSPAKPGETILLYANGFGPTSSPVVNGSPTQSGILSPLPVVQIGGITAAVAFAGLVAPGEFQFNVLIPGLLMDGDQPMTAIYNGFPTQAGTLITIQH